MCYFHPNKRQINWKMTKMTGADHGTLVAVHDGSYMKEVNPQACSAAFMIRCSATGLRAKGTVAEWSDSADNYRAEILGGL